MTADERFWKGLAEIVHELRSPLSTILIAVEVLEKETAGHLTPEASRHLALIEKNAERLSGMIEDSLAMSSLKKELPDFQPERVETGPFLESLIQETKPLFDHKGLNLSLHVSEDATSSFTSDEKLLRRILVNLLTNACKFTRKGGAELRVQGSDDLLEFTVVDSGTGIPRNEASHVFKEFYRAGNAAGEPGIGLGLALASRLATILNGSLSFESNPGEGSAFTLSLPLKGRRGTDSDAG